MTLIGLSQQFYQLKKIFWSRYVIAERSGCQKQLIRGWSQEMTSILMDGIRLIEKMNDFILNKLEKINSPTLNLHYYYKRIEYQRCNSNLYKEDKFNYNQLMSQN